MTSFEPPSIQFTDASSIRSANGAMVTQTLSEDFLLAESSSYSSADKKCN